MLFIVSVSARMVTVDLETAAERSKDGKEWRDCVQSSMKGEVGWAHRWTKKLEAWQPVSVKHRQRYSGRPQHILQVEADRRAAR